MKKDFSSEVSPVQAIGPVVLAADNTPAAIDMSNFGAAVIALSIGIGGITFDATNKVEFKLTHSDDTTYAAVAQEDVKGVTVGTGGIIKSLVAAHAAASITEIGYHGGKRYLKLLADFSGTHGVGTPISAVVVRGLPYIAPVA
jgi:hypothetical protein